MKKREQRQDVPWCIVGPPPHLGSCLRCGAHLPMPPMGITVPSLVKYMAGFNDIHAQCKPAQAQADVAAAFAGKELP